MKSHLKTTPFLCPICGFKSGRKDNLKQHIEKRHCSSDINLGQLETMYPNMYKDQETERSSERALGFHENVETRLFEERKQIQRYSVEERLLDQRSMERLNIERLEDEKKEKDGRKEQKGRNEKEGGGKEKEGQDSEGRIDIVERRVIIESKETDVIDLFLPT